MNTNNNNNFSNRLNLIDALRGLAIISMIFYHAVWIMNSFSYGLSDEILYGPACIFWERTICMTFILISGFSFSLGHKHLKNAALTFFLGAVITLVTCLFVPDIRIIFGVLTFLGTAGLLMIPLDKWLYRIRNSILFENLHLKTKPFLYFSALLSLLLFLLSYDIKHRYIGLFGHSLFALPDKWYSGYFMTYLGFLDPTFFSSDYFPVIPWIFWYFLGYFLEKISRNTTFRNTCLKKNIPFLGFLGRHSLIIYVIHPIVIFAAVYIFSIVSQP